MIDQMTYPVVAWTHWGKGEARYVSHLPGDGGVDWGYTNRIEGNRGFDKALPLSKWHWQRFAKDCRRMGKAAFCMSAPGYEQEVGA